MSFQMSVAEEESILQKGWTWVTMAKPIFQIIWTRNLVSTKSASAVFHLSDYAKWHIAFCLR